MTGPEESSRLQESWAWLRDEYNQLDILARTTDDILRDPDQARAHQIEMLIEWGRRLCDVLRECRRRGLFDEIADNDYASNARESRELRNQLREHLRRVMIQEQAVLVVAGIDDRAARALCEDIERRLREHPGDPMPYAAPWHKRVEEAVEVACSVPSNRVMYYAHNVGRQLRRLKKRHGMIGLVALAGANTAISIHVPEPILATKFSKLIAYLLLPTSGEDEPGLEEPPSDWTI